MDGMADRSLDEKETERMNDKETESRYRPTYIKSSLELNIKVAELLQ